ncbi:MAG: hypothetical protein ABIJ31_06230 [Pseudomonadota bacterium]
MDRITINTGMAGFLLLKGIRAVSSEKIIAWTCFSDAPAFEIIEALAQTGAMHVRFLCEFDCHAFLLKINRFECFTTRPFSGEWQLQADLMIRTQSAFSYQVTAAARGKALCSAELSFAVKPYDQRFKQGDLKAHYRNMFECLSP